MASSKAKVLAVRPELEAKAHTAAGQGQSDKRALCLTPKKVNRHHRNQSSIGSPKSANAAEALSPGNISPQPNRSPSSLSDRPASPALKSPNASPGGHPRRTGRSRNHTRSRSSIDFNPIRSFCIEVEGVDAARRVVSPPPPPAMRSGAFTTRVLSPPSASSPGTTKDRTRETNRSKSPPASVSVTHAPSPLRLSRAHQLPTQSPPTLISPPPPPPQSQTDKQSKDPPLNPAEENKDGVPTPTASSLPSVSDHIQGSTSVMALRRQLFEQKAGLPAASPSVVSTNSPGLGAQILRKVTKADGTESIASPSISSTIRSLQQLTSPPPSGPPPRTEAVGSLARSESFENSKKSVAKTIENVVRKNSAQQDSPTLKSRASDTALTRLRSPEPTTRPPPFDSGNVLSVVSGSVTDCATRKRAGSSIPPPPPPTSSHATASVSASAVLVKPNAVSSPSAIGMVLKSPPPPHSLLSPPWVPLPPPAQPTPPPPEESNTTPRREELNKAAPVGSADDLASQNLSPVSAACTSSAAAFRTHESLLASLRMSAEEKDPQTGRRFRVSDYLQASTPPIIRPMSPGALASRISNTQVRSPVTSVSSPPSKAKVTSGHPPALSLLAAIASPRQERRDTVQKAKPSEAPPRVSATQRGDEEAARGVSRLIAGTAAAPEPLVNPKPQEEADDNGPECSVMTTAETSILENAIELPNGQFITDNDIVIKQGTLQKRVHTSIWALQRSQKRHFVLSQTYLSYYKKRPDRLTAKRPTVILLEHISSVRCFSEGPKRAIFGVSGGNNFNIATGSCRFDITLLPHKVVDHMVSNGLDSTTENAKSRAHYTLIADSPADALQWVTLISNALYRIQSQPSQWRPSWHQEVDGTQELSVTRMLKNVQLGTSFGSGAGSSTHEWSDESSLVDGESETSLSHESSEDDDDEDEEEEESVPPNSLLAPLTGRRPLGSLSTAGGSCLSEASLTLKSECGGEQKVGGPLLSSLQRSYHKHVEGVKDGHPSSNMTVLYSLLFVLSGSVSRDESAPSKTALTTSAPSNATDKETSISSAVGSSKRCAFKGCLAPKSSGHGQYCSAHYRKTSKGGDTLNTQMLAELAILKDIHLHQKLIEWSNTRKALRAVSKLLCGTEDRHEQDLSIRCLFLMLHRKSSAIPHSAGCVQVVSGCELASRTSANSARGAEGPSASPGGHSREDSRAEVTLLKLREAAATEEKGGNGLMKPKKRMSMANIYTVAGHSQAPPLARPLPEPIAEGPSEQELPSVSVTGSKSLAPFDAETGSIVECESCGRLASYFAAYLRKAVTGQCSIAPFSPSEEAGRSSRFTHTMWRSILALLITPLPDISHVDPEHLLSFNQSVCNTQVWRAAFECLCRASLEIRIAALEDLNGLLIGSPINREVLLCQPRWPSLISSLLLDLDHLNGETECKKPQTLTKSKQDEYQSFQFTTNIFTLLLFHSCVGISTDDASEENSKVLPATHLAQPTAVAADTAIVASSFLSRSNSGSITSATKDGKEKLVGTSASSSSAVSRPFQAIASFFTRKRGKSSEKQPPPPQTSAKVPEPSSGKPDPKILPARPISTPLSPTTVPAPASLARQFFPSSESKPDQIARPQVKLSLVVCHSFQDLLVETVRTIQRSFHNAPPSLLYARSILMALVNKVSANKSLLRTDYSHQSWENAVRLGEAVKTFLFCTPTLGQAPATDATRDRNRTLSRGSMAVRADSALGRARRVSSSATVRFGDLVGFGLHWEVNDELALGDLELAKSTAKLIHSINPVNHMQEGTEAEVEEYLNCSGSYSPADKEMILRLRLQTDFFQHAITMLELLGSQKQKLSHWEVSSFVEELFIAVNRKGQSRVIDSVKARIALHCKKS